MYQIIKIEQNFRDYHSTRCSTTWLLGASSRR